MPSYTNPSSMFGGLTPGNPLQNALVGMRMPYEQAFADQDLRSNDLDFMARLHQYEQSVLDDPMKASERDLKTANNKEDLGLIEDGTYRSRKVADTDQAIATAKKTKEEALSKETENRLNFLNDLSEELKVRPFNPLTDGDRWKSFVADGDKVGVKLPSMPSDQVIQQIHAKSEAATNSLKQKQKIRELVQQGDNALAPHIDPRSGASAAAQEARDARLSTSREEAVKIASVSKEKIAALKAAQDQRYNNLNQVTASTIRNTVAAEMRTTGSLSQSTIDQVKAYAQLEARERAKDDISYIKVDAMPEGPAKEAAMKAVLTPYYKQIIDTIIPSGSAAGQAVSSPDNPASGSPSIPTPKAIGSKAEYDSLPKGAEYLWNGKKGVKK